MSIADKLVRLSDARDDIIDALTQQFVDATGHGFEDFPADILSILPILVTKNIDANGTYIASSDNAHGYSVVDVLVQPGLVTPYYVDLNPNKYVMSTNLRLNGSTVNYSDVYQVQQGVQYILSLGSDVGTRFRALLTTEDSVATTVDLTGTNIVNRSDPSPYDFVSFTPKDNYYLTVTKDNAGKAGIPTYLFIYREVIRGLVE